MRIPFIDLAPDDTELSQIMEAVRGVVRRGIFILGPNVEAFEEELAANLGVAHVVGVGSGTDALILGMQSLGIGPGDEVILPAFTAFPTLAAVLQVGATPRLVDVEGGPMVGREKVMNAVNTRTRAVVVVHMYGVPLDVRALKQDLDARGIPLIEDCAQALGAQIAPGISVGTVGRFGAFSFYPTKNLAALGDGGAIATDDAQLAADAKAWRSHGERSVRYRHELPARNSRLDELQAAVLRMRLKKVVAEVAVRRGLSELYRESLPLEAGYVSHGNLGAPHLSVIEVNRRDELRDHLESLGIGTMVHYPLALNQQPVVLAKFGQIICPNAESWAARCLSLPLSTRLTDVNVKEVADAISAWLSRQ